MELLYDKELTIPVDEVQLEGNLVIPFHAIGLVIFSHGSGSSRLSPRNKMVAGYLHQKKFGTLLFDLLTRREDQDYEMRFDIDLLTRRLIGATTWLEKQPFAKSYPLGYFGASTGAASALNAAAALPQIGAVVSRGGRPDLAMSELARVQSPTLLIVGGLDYDVIRLNELAYAQLHCEKEMKIVKGATHLFEEKGKMEEVCALAGSWFSRFLVPAAIAK